MCNRCPLDVYGHNRNMFLHFYCYDIAVEGTPAAVCHSFSTFCSVRLAVSVSILRGRCQFAVCLPLQALQCRYNCSLHEVQCSWCRWGNRQIHANLDYSGTKGDADTVDHMCASYAIARVTQRWPLPLFYIHLDIAGINVNIFFKFNNIENRDKSCFKERTPGRTCVVPKPSQRCSNLSSKI